MEVTNVSHGNSNSPLYLGQKQDELIIFQDQACVFNNYKITGPKIFTFQRQFFIGNYPGMYNQKDLYTSDSDKIYKNGSLLHKIPDFVYLFTFYLFGGQIFSILETGIWEIHTNKLIRFKDLEINETVTSCEIYQNILLLGTEQGNLYQVDLNSLNSMKIYNHVSTISEIRLNGNYLVVRMMCNELVVLDYQLMTEIFSIYPVFKIHSVIITDQIISFSNNQGEIFTLEEIDK
ncbi:hypothetical protein SS50377_23734 [Spironucleus salmonicida]|uniref:Uncharacterized protein n=1 Tax=Spironucleus salmonicida TaxID=348837 RepID=V6LQ90_9EUKA|nr:hypothetical protein SS50377_23734 [Spironucleus salmonicida]|eukprot:EST46413.1 Hypothetical protein SS50377_13497 [Spironucleus salmonicida]